MNASTFENPSRTDFFPNLRRVIAVGWGQIAGRQITNVDRFYSMCPEQVADFLGGRLLNFGYWADGAESQQDAAEALVHEVAKYAEIRPGDKVLDVGCGFGVAAMMFHQQYNASQVVGVNVTQCHLEFAQRAAAAKNVDDCVHFQFADATDLPFNEVQFDHVIALESAFHFAPREAFFREAARVLKPGGVLTIADATPMKPRSGRVLKYLAAKLWLFPLTNHYGPQGYVERVGDVGFEKVESRSIGDTVYPGYVRWTIAAAKEKKLGKRLGWIKSTIYGWQTKLLGVLSRRGELEYLLIRAVKGE